MRFLLPGSGQPPCLDETAHPTVITSGAMIRHRAHLSSSMVLALGVIVSLLLLLIVETVALGVLFQRLGL